MNKLYNKWLKIESKQIQDKLKNLSCEERESAFSGTLSFGTAGLRGIMALGTNRMNEVNVCKLASCVLMYYQKNKLNRIVIGYDTRHNSKEYANIFARVMANGGVTVNLFKSIILIFPRKNTGFSVTAGTEELTSDESFGKDVLTGLSVSSTAPILTGGDVTHSPTTGPCIEAGVTSNLIYLSKRFVVIDKVLSVFPSSGIYIPSYTSDTSQRKVL